MKCDVTEEQEVVDAVRQTIEKFGGLDVMVNNAGYTWDSTIQKMTDEQFQAMLDVHLVAPFRILRAASEPIRIMAKQEAEAGRDRPLEERAAAEPDVLQRRHLIVHVDDAVE